MSLRVATCRHRCGLLAVCMQNRVQGLHPSACHALPASQAHLTVGASERITTAAVRPAMTLVPYVTLADSSTAADSAVASPEQHVLTVHNP